MRTRWSSPMSPASTRVPHRAGGCGSKRRLKPTWIGTPAACDRGEASVDLGQVERQRLLAEDGLAGRPRRSSAVDVGVGRRADRDGVDVVRRRAAPSTSVVCGRQSSTAAASLRPLGVDVVDHRQGEARARGGRSARRASGRCVRRRARRCAVSWRGLLEGGLGRVSRRRGPTGRSRRRCPSSSPTRRRAGRR